MIKALTMLFFLNTLVTATEFYMLDFKLQSLHKQQEIDLNGFKGKILFLTFIKSECSWCDKQLNAFNTVLKGEHAEGIQVVAVAMGEDDETLKAKTSESEFPVLKASEQLLESIGGVKMTPYTLIADREGNFETKIVGYKSDDQIESIIHQLEGKK